MKSGLFSILLVLGAVAAPAFAATRTVKTDQTGDHTTIQACADVAQPGDTCLVSAGTYSALSFATSGAAGNRITIQAAAGARPLITGRVNFTNGRYITVDGFELRSGVGCNGCSFIEIKNNLVSNTDIGIGGSGGSCGSSAFLCGTDILIDGNTFPDRGDDVFKPNGSRWVIRNNYANGIVDSAGEHIDFVQYACTNPSLSFQLIENNVYSNITGGNTQFLMMNCTEGSHSNYIVRQNKIRDIGAQPIAFIESGSQITGAMVYNNVFYDCCGSNTYAIRSDASPESFQNNIYYNAMTPSGARGVSDNGNCDGSLAFDPDGPISLVNGQCLDSSSGVVLNKNPNFVNAAADDYSLRAGSPAVDAGTYLTTVATADNGSGTTLVVANAYFFQDGWAGTQPDRIAVGSVSNAVQISSINYSTNTITLAAPISRSDGNPVYLYADSDGTQVLYGSAPDIGPVESQFTGSTGSQAPSAPTNLSIVR